MRLLLDAHVSGRRVGDALRVRGHDVRAVDQESELEGLPDEALLELATAERRVLVTFDVGDFPGILRALGIAGRRHAGLILVYGVLHREHGPTIRGIEQRLERRPNQSDWIDVADVISPGALR